MHQQLMSRNVSATKARMSRDMPNQAIVDLRNSRSIRSEDLDHMKQPSGEEQKRCRQQQARDQVDELLNKHGSRAGVVPESRRFIGLLCKASRRKETKDKRRIGGRVWDASLAFRGKTALCAQGCGIHPSVYK